jgi:lambda family phage portal protein
MFEALAARIPGLRSRAAKPARARSLDAAGGGRRWANAPTLPSLNSAVLAGATVSAHRAAYYTRNNPWIASAVDSLVSNAVGTGIKPRSQHPDPAVRDGLHRLWDAWQRRADAAGLLDFYGLQALAVRAMIEGGEAFARLRTRLPVDGLDVPFQVEMVDREQVPTDQVADVAGARVRAGIEFDALGRRVAFHVHRARPGDPLATSLPIDLVRVPAADMLHLFEPVAPGQLRGVTWLAPILLRLRELDAFEDAALTKAKVAALFAGFITDPAGDGAGLADPAGDGTADLAMEPGALVPLRPGQDVRFAEPKTDTAYGEFVRNQLRAIAAGLGLPYEAMSGDYSATNYSSARAALVEHRRRIERLQHGIIVPMLCRPVWERFVRVAVLSGALPARDFERDEGAYLSAEWLPPAFDWVDPGKDVAAEIAAIGAGLKSRTQALAERGYDAERIDAEIAADRAREARLGLSFAAPAPAAPSEPAP